VHFHELGGIDAIVDIVGVAAALEVLDVAEVASSAVSTGTGVVRTAHGLLPNPAPAVVELLAGAPVRGLDVPVELTTPTGAALLATMASQWGPLPPMTVDATGFGAGSAELEALPNLTQVVLGTAASRDAPAGQPLTLLEANLDDATGETLAVAVAALLEAGAADAWITPIVMKKGRPAHTVSALCDPVLAESLAAVLATETGTLGVRSTAITRWPAARRSGVVEVDGASVRVKVGPGRVKVEHDDAARAARRTGLPVREVVSRAEEAWRREGRGEVVELPSPPDPSGDAG
jgi:pyridinium-3,5-bisthiocarboxylic acid mononucleotide nickel chelatase